MHYEQNIDGCLAGTVGEYGLTEGELTPLLKAATQALEDLREGAVVDAAGVLALPVRQDDIEIMTPIAGNLRSRFSDIIVLGTGGSSLGGRAITRLVSGDGPNLRFVDNLDPLTMTSLIETVDFRRTGFLVISKSGTTTETMAQYLACFEAAERTLGDDTSAHFVVITDPTDNVLRQLATERGHTVLDHDPGVGGRFSVLSIVGMLPAAIAGLDPLEIRAGALTVLEHAFETSEIDPSPATLGAAISLGLERHHGATMSVVMPYGDALEPLAAWQCQLWAESLGKDGVGTTPIRALGPVDQHSQLQLYLDGPRDKMFTIIETATGGKGPVIPAEVTGKEEIAYLNGISIGDLVAAQQAATAETLIARGRPTRILRITQPDAASMGALFMHFMLETIVAARMLGVNAFDQPAVEEGKTRTRDRLTRSGRR